MLAHFHVHEYQKGRLITGFLIFLSKSQLTGYTIKLQGIHSLHEIAGYVSILL